MKSRQKFTVSEKNIVKRSDLEPDTLSDRRTKKKVPNNPLIQKNLNFLQTYNNLFRKPAGHVGDADSFFRNSLRNEPFDLLRDLHLQNYIVKSVRSFECLHKVRKPRSKRTLLSPKENPNRYSYLDLNFDPAEQGDLHVKEIYSYDKERSDSDTDSEEKKYYSPINDLVDLEEVEEVSEDNAAPSTLILKDSKPKLGLSLHVKMDPENEENIDKPEDEQSEGEEIPAGENEPEGKQIEDEEEPIQMEPEDEEKADQDTEMDEVGKMIEQANNDLDQMKQENRKIMDAIKEEPTETNQGGDGSTFQFDPTIDAAVLKELEDAEKQAKETAKIINELKGRVGELLQKEQMTEEEGRELEQKNKELRAQMLLFEEKTKRIQFLIGQSNLFENMIPPKPALQAKHNEDMLPKVIVCGLTENNMPKLIICDNNKKCRPKSSPKPPSETQQPPAQQQMVGMPQIAKKLNECYCMQEKLAAENAALEGNRYKLQSDLLNKDQTVECLQRQLTNLQNEMRMVCKENALLNEKIESCGPTCGHPCSQQSSPRKAVKMPPCGKGRGICPADIESRLKEYSENTQNLEKQLGDMEAEVRAMQHELIAVQKEREHLEHHRRMMCVPPPCYPPPCPPPTCYPPPCPQSPCPPAPCGPQPPCPQSLCASAPCGPQPPCAPHPCVQPPCAPKPGAEQHLRELKEQYARLQDDFKGKLTEVAGLRADNEKLKDTSKLAEEAKKAAEDKLKEFEEDLKKLKSELKALKGSSTKEQLIEQEQQLNVAKQRFREAQDELEELRALVQDQQQQLDDYRNKYLEAQQQVEEQRRQIDMMEMENQRIGEQVNLEIQRVKNQFQEKLQELIPLPDILKSTQIKLQEAQQMHLLAERNNESMARELQLYKDKIAAMFNQMDEVRSDQQLGEDEKATLLSKIDELESSLAELQQQNDKLINDLEALQERSDEFERTSEERIHQITQLESQLESLREETARQVARTKDRCEIVRRSMQNQISDLEKQLAQSRALAKTAQKDRDEIRQKMQAQINNLNENFEDAQMRIRNLQGHVNFLKNSYGTVFPSTDNSPPKEICDPCNCGTDY